MDLDLMGCFCDHCDGGKVYCIIVEGWKVWVCANCGRTSEVQVPKGTSLVWTPDEVKGTEYEARLKPYERTTYEGP